MAKYLFCAICPGQRDCPYGAIRPPPPCPAKLPAPLPTIIPKFVIIEM